MSYLDDPRVFFAAERTALAWMRTGLATMGLGFVVARFGLFMQALGLSVAHHGQKAAMAIGVILVLLGAASCWWAGARFRGFLQLLSATEIPKERAPSASAYMAYGMAFAGVMLVVYLVMA